jgi:hypothetical protein
VKPEFLKKLEDVEVKELQTAILEVEITSPSADVTWHKVSRTGTGFCGKGVGESE